MMSVRFLILFAILSTSMLAQKKVNTDSLLTVVLKDIKNSLLYDSIEKNCRIAIKNSPKYYDFHLVMGELFYKKNEIDSCRKYLNIITDNTSSYKDAFILQVKNEIRHKNRESALRAANIGLNLFPEDDDLKNLKISALLIIDSKTDERKIVDSLLKLMPKDIKLLNYKNELVLRNDFNKIGIEHSYTFFNRNAIGPWHLAGLNYVYTKEKITVVSRINYANRTINNSGTNQGFQVEFESYYKHMNKNYSYASIAIGDEIVFPQLRLAYSFFQYLGKGFEGDLGLRYTKAPNVNLYTLAIGAGKYIGSYWINSRSYLHVTNNAAYPVFEVVGRYYFNTKYDYCSAVVGYGTSPDERIFIGLLNERVALKSFRIGAGYNKFISKKIILGINMSYNNQEYIKNKTQSEWTSAILLQCKL